MRKPGPGLLTAFWCGGFLLQTALLPGGSFAKGESRGLPFSEKFPSAISIRQ